MEKGSSAVFFLLLVAFAAADSPSTPSPGPPPSRPPPPPPPAICGLDLDEGTCEDFTEQFFYNSTSKACETFFYGGCDGNENRFLSEKECSETCGDKGKCELHPEVGVCRGIFPRYFYNATSKQCEKFIYGGCGGNENNFETLQYCQKNCSGPQCPVAGQVFQDCASPCNATCSNPSPICILVCQPGCACPSGQVIDTSKNKCVPVDSCPGKPRNCSDVECPSLECAHIRPANPDKGRCCPTCVQGNQTNCSQVVNCPPSRCPNPIPANHTAGKCCATCPNGSSCPVIGQVFQSCASPCNATCSNPNPLCILVCQPGCACPSGQVIDTSKNRCVPVDSCFKNQTKNCSAVVDCPPPRCPNPIPANHTAGKCCATCPEGSRCPVAGQVFQNCASPCNATCSNPSPICILVCEPGCACPSGQVIDTKRNRCVPVDSCPADCSKVNCPPVSCPNPILANPANGSCCNTCPKDSTCPIAGQFYDFCGSACPTTCANHDLDIICIQVCLAGCHCPSGQVIDEDSNSCVAVEDCPVADICQLPAEKGNCRAKMTRYYYDSDAGKCQQFNYGGCNGNENNFQTMRECRKECEKSSSEPIDCSNVECAAPTCPDPIPANPDEGECCSKCPEGSACPFKGQVYHECVGCPPTCNNYDEIVPCLLICLPGCACPTGTVLDEQSGTCVPPGKCPGKCELHPEVGVCRGIFPRYFYNATSKQCEKFIYGGCGGNENNFETLEYCQKNCSECAPTCTPDFCKGKLRAKCSVPGKTPGDSSCFGACDETVCSACYYSNETLSMPTLKKDCPTLCPVDAKGEIFGKTCLRDWGKCVRSANLDTYGKPTSDMKTAENFKCWRPSCQSLA